MVNFLLLLFLPFIPLRTSASRRAAQCGRIVFWRELLIIFWHQQRVLEASRASSDIKVDFMWNSYYFWHRNGMKNISNRTAFPFDSLPVLASTYLCDNTNDIDHKTNGMNVLLTAQLYNCHSIKVILQSEQRRNVPLNFSKRARTIAPPAKWFHLFSRPCENEPNLHHKYTRDCMKSELIASNYRIIQANELATWSDIVWRFVQRPLIENATQCLPHCISTGRSCTLPNW